MRSEKANILLFNCDETFMLKWSEDVLDQLEKGSENTITYGYRWSMIEKEHQLMNPLPYYSDEFIKCLGNKGHKIDRMEFFLIRTDPFVEYHMSYNKSIKDFTESITCLKSKCIVVLTEVEGRVEDISVELLEGRTVLIREELKRNFTISIHAVEEEVVVVRTLCFIS